MFQKNVAGQKIGAQMVTAADGSAFTGSVTVFVTVDAGTQGTGSVSSGACTHEGNGYHTYAPAQAETNGTLIAFTFTGTGAVPNTVQVFTAGFDVTLANWPVNLVQILGTTLTETAGLLAGGFKKFFNVAAPTLTCLGVDQTGDNYVRLGAPAGASVSADVSAVKAVLPSALTTGGRMKASVEAILDTTFTEGATGRIAAAFKQFFNIASPAATMDHGVLVDTVTTATTATNLTTNNDKTGYRLSATGVDDVWDEVQSGHTTAGTFGKFLDVAVSSVTSGALSAAGVWDYLLSAITTSGSIGKLLKDDIDAAVSTRSTYAGGAVASVTAGVTVTTNNDKTGYALTAGYDPAKTAAQAGDAMALTSGERTSVGTAVWASATRSLTTFGTLVVDVWASVTRTLTAGTNIVLAKGTGVTGFTDLDAAGVRSAVGLASANLDTQIGAVPTAIENADALLVRDLSAVEASAPEHSLASAAMAAVCKIEDDGAGHLIVYRTNGTTEHYRRDFVTSPTAEPIVQIGDAH